LEYFSSKILEGTYSPYTLICAMDEAGKPCPLADDFTNSVLKNKNSLTGTQVEKDLMDTCLSNVCKVATHDALQIFTSTSVDDIKDLSTIVGSINFNISRTQSLIDFLNSDECKAIASGGAADASAANGNASDAISGSSTLKISTGLFISLGLLLLSFY